MNWIQITKRHDPALYETVREIAGEAFEDLDLRFRAYLDLRDGRIVVVYGMSNQDAREWLGTVKTVVRLGGSGSVVRLGRGINWNSEDGSVIDAGLVPFPLVLERADKRARAVFEIDADVLPYESVAIPS